jgi:Na+/melibiose symporter-like transporter|tara:strand:- start:238 stop:381 length:144 start_codon:yes stop_codon:yes gene_type:complete
MMIGILIATFFLIGLVFNIRKKYKILKKDHDLINKEVQNLRRIPIQE